MTRGVLHVLPHPGGGGDTYVDALSAIVGYELERMYLASSADPARARLAILRRAIEVPRAARRYDLVHVHGEVAAGLSLPALVTRPSVVTLHGLHLVRRMGGLGQAAARTNLRLVVRAASRTICVSGAEYNQLGSLLGERALRRAVVVRNGVDALDPFTADERAAARAELGVSAEALAGAWVAGLDEHKDPLSPIHAVGKAREQGAQVTLLVAGDGPLRAEAERAAGGRGAVRVLGFRRDVDRILGASDFFVLSSQREGLSFSLLQAMAHGLAPVVSDEPANVEAVGDAGIVVPFGDVARFAEAFARLAADPEERRTLGDRARERAARHFSLVEMVDRTREVYGEVLREGSSLRRRRAES